MPATVKPYLRLRNQTREAFAFHAASPGNASSAVMARITFHGPAE